MKRKQHLLSLIIFGTISILMYSILFLNQDMVMEYYTKGGWYTFLPIVTVLIVSFVHGAFASNVWSVMGFDKNEMNSRNET